MSGTIGLKWLYVTKTAQNRLHWLPEKNASMTFRFDIYIYIYICHKFNKNYTCVETRVIELCAKYRRVGKVPTRQVCLSLIWTLRRKREGRGCRENKTCSAQSLDGRKSVTGWEGQKGIRRRGRTRRRRRRGKKQKRREMSRSRHLRASILSCLRSSSTRD